MSQLRGVYVQTFGYAAHMFVFYENALLFGVPTEEYLVLILFSCDQCVALYLDVSQYQIAFSLIDAPLFSHHMAICP